MAWLKPGFSSWFASLATAGAVASAAAAWLCLPLGADAAATRTSSLLGSRQLWATVDVCNSAKQPNTIGIRGSMPGDGRAKDTMWMRFTVQYLEPATQKWVSLGRRADSGFVKVGSAQIARQAGQSFQFGSLAGQPPVMLRGAVMFEWRRGRKVVAKAQRATTAGHKSLAGAEPPGYSAAACKLP